MNLLAHAILSPPHDDPLLVGNLTADWIKGRARLALSPAIQSGFALHRRIDDFTDTHPIVNSCANLLADKWGRYASVLVDIFFDHLLAAQFSDHHAEPLDRFSAVVYEILHAHRPLLPERANFAIRAMTMDDWFGTYATSDGIRLTLTRMSARLRHDIELAPAMDDFLRHRAAFEQSFHIFFPQLRGHIAHLRILKECA